MTLCNKCELCKSRHSEIAGEGNKDAIIVLVGTGPGFEDDEVGRPFVGPAGRILNTMLKKAGIERKDIWISNVIRCIPRFGKTVREPNEVEIAACSTNLEAELAALPNKKIIIPLGNVAMKYIMRLRAGAITTKRGKEEHSEIYKCWVMPTFHPAAVARVPKFEAVVVEDLKKAQSLISGTFARDKVPTDYKFIDTIEKFDEIYNVLINAPEFSYDIETTGLEFYRDHILTIGISWAIGKACFIPFMKCGGDDTPFWNDKQSYIIEKLRDLFANSAKKVAQNAKFDNQFLRREGMPVKNFYFDTLLAHHLLDENAEGMHGLKTLSWTYTDIGGYEKEIEEYWEKNKKVKYQMLHVSLPVIAKYNCCDADATFRLYKVFEPMLIEQGLMRLFKQIIIPLEETLLETEWIGIKYDLKWAREFKVQCETTMKETEEKIFAAAGGKINLKSPQQLRKLLFETLKLKAPSKTPKGEGSTDEESLQTLLKTCQNMNNQVGLDVLSSLMAYRKATKIVSTYIDGLVKRVDDKGRIYADFVMTGTITGRLSARNPSLHNITRDDNIRGLFIPEDGWKIMEVDLRQAEVRVWASFIRDPKLIADIKSGKDIYRVIGAGVFGVEEDKVTETQRDMMKGLVLGLMYGRGVWSIADEFKISVPAAQRIVDSFFSRYPYSQKWFAETLRTARQTGQVRNLFGRLRRLPGIDSSDSYIKSEVERQAINSPIQSSSSDFTGLLANRIRQTLLDRGFKSRMVLTIHDSLIYEVPNEEVDDVQKIVFDTVQLPVEGMLVPMDFKIKIGDRWSVA